MPGFPVNSTGKEFACNAGDLGLIPGLERSPGRGHGNPLQYSCLENPHGQRSLAGYSPWGHKESDTAEQLSTAQHTDRCHRPCPGSEQCHPVCTPPPYCPVWSGSTHSRLGPWGHCPSCQAQLPSCWARETRQVCGHCQDRSASGAGREFTETEVKASFPDFCWARAPHQTQPDGFLAAKSLAAASFRRLPTTGFLRFSQLSSLATYNPLPGLRPALANAFAAVSKIKQLFDEQHPNVTEPQGGRIQTLQKTGSPRSCPRCWQTGLPGAANLGNLRPS